MYFRSFEKGYYDLKNDGQWKTCHRLNDSCKSKRENCQWELSLYDKYEVPSGERPEDTNYLNTLDQVNIIG